MMRGALCGMLFVAVLIPMAPTPGWATPSVVLPFGAPPLASTPAQPQTPPAWLDLQRPPVLRLLLARPSEERLATIFSVRPARQLAPGFDVPPGPPDLSGFVALPELAFARVSRYARPFGGSRPDVPPDNNPVPEPGTALLMLTGLWGLAAVGRRRR